VAEDGHIHLMSGAEPMRGVFQHKQFRIGDTFLDGRTQI
jgi:hypothetical protein